MAKVELLRLSLFSIQVCTDIPPERAKEELEDAVAYAILPPGTMANRWVLDERTDPPVRCADNPDRWHYILVC